MKTDEQLRDELAEQKAHAYVKMRGLVHRGETFNDLFLMLQSMWLAARANQPMVEGFPAPTGPTKELVEAGLEVVRRWDALGINKDDDFGEVQIAMEVFRTKLAPFTEKGGA